MRSRKFKNQKIFRFVQFLFGALFIFILALQVCVKTPSPFPNEGERSHFYANQCDDHFCPLIKKAISEARHSILLIIYTLGDPTLICALEQKAREGVLVKVIEDPNMSKKHPLLKGIETVLYDTR